MEEIRINIRSRIFQIQKIALLVVALTFASCTKQPSPEGVSNIPVDVTVPNDTIPANDTLPDKDSIPGEDSIPIIDTIPVVDTIPIVDTIPVEDTVQTVIMGFGSSTIDRWNLQKAFPHKKMEKAGYSGYRIEQLLTETDTIEKVDPTQVLLYAGTNDVAARRTTSQVTLSIQELMQKIWKENPGVHITYITMHPFGGAFTVQSSNEKEPGIQVIENVNKNILSWIRANHSHHASVVDSYASFISWNPKRINLKYFEEDKVHLNQHAGYPLLNKLTASKLK